MPQPNRYVTARLQFRKGSTSEWLSNDPVLQEGEPGYDTDIGKLKIGDGQKVWSALPFVEDGGNGAWVNDNSGLFPNFIQSQGDAINYVKHHHDLLEDNANAYFDAGLGGDAFEQLFELNLTSSTGGFASIDGEPRKYNSYSDGTQVAITATATGGYSFQSWQGGVDDPNSAQTTVTMDSAKSINAVFVL